MPNHYDTTGRPLAAHGLNSYRYRDRYGWVMIGARDHAEALAEAARSIDGQPSPYRLEVWDGQQYARARGCRLYHIVAINERSGRKEYLTAYPMPHQPACVMLLKQGIHPLVRKQLEEAA
jgi:hypothetical protein